MLLAKHIHMHRTNITHISNIFKNLAVLIYYSLIVVIYLKLENTFNISKKPKI